MSTVVFVHAHPDDEAIATAGTMADLAAAGHRVVLVTATAGELGEVPDGMLAAGESLADRRAVELAAAGRLLGVARQSYLGYHDSGMAGEEADQRPDSFARADVEEAAARLAKLLEEEEADVLVVYDEHGGYGHPDHVQVHTVGVRAGELAGTPRVYMATQDRGYLQAMRDRANFPSPNGQAGPEIDAGPAGEAGWSPPEDVADMMETMGEPSARITTQVDVTRWIDAKRGAMQAHATQIPEDSFFLSMPPDVFEMVWGQEWYIRIRPEAPNPFPGPRETSLLDA